MGRDCYPVGKSSTSRSRDSDAKKLITWTLLLPSVRVPGKSWYPLNDMFPFLEDARFVKVMLSVPWLMLLMDEALHHLGAPIHCNSSNSRV